MISYKCTVKSCYIGYFTQAIINNLAPVFFVIFQKSYGISLSLISWLIFINFGVQILTDIASVFTVERIGVRRAVVGAHILSVLGLGLLGILPLFVPPFLGLTVAIIIYAAGSGLIEVLVSPIIDSIPLGSKSSAMSLLHSFYCWGQLAVVLITTLLLKLIGIDKWFILPILWAIIPFINIFNFLKAPLLPIAKEEKTPLRSLFKTESFMIFALLMLCAGATEITVSQWSSLFAERGLGVSKVVGDILGPCLFALLMGIGRAFYGVRGAKMNLYKSLTFCAVLGIFCYLLISFSPVPFLSLIGCALTGLAVSLMWPGVLSLSSAHFPKSGTAMFSIMALFGDIGCTTGPYIAGQIAELAENHLSTGLFGLSPESAGLKIGIFTAIIFPAAMLILLNRTNKSNKTKEINKSKELKENV